MINLPINQLKPGMTICQSIYDTNGIFLLNRGTVLNDFYIKKIKATGLREVAVFSNTIMGNNIVTEGTRSKTVKKLADILKIFQNSGSIPIPRLKNNVISIIREISHSENVLVQMNDLRAYDSYTMVHSVDTAILSSFIGVLLKLPPKDLEHLTIGAMLHDIGKIFIPNEIINKPSALSDEEFTLIKTHPAESAKRLEACGFPEDIVKIALEHHERIDGSGYPQHLVGDKIHPFAKIVAIADVYDALTSVRSYKKAYKPHIAYNIMTQCFPNNFDENIMQLFFDYVAIYPLGSILKTSLGSAIVYDVLPKHTYSPIVYLFADKDEHLLTTPKLLNLAEENVDCQTKGVYTDYEVMNLTNRLKFDPTSLLLAKYKVNSPKKK